MSTWTRLVSTEILKIRSTRSWWVMLIAMVVLIVAITAFSAAFAGRTLQGAPPLPGPDDPAMARSLYTGGLTSFGYVFTLALGVLVICTEFRHQTVTPTFLATPRRYRVILVKWVAAALFGILFGVVGVLSSTVTAALVFTMRGYDVDLLGDGVPRALALAVLGFAVWAVLGVGLGTLLRNQVVALLVGVGFTALIEPIISAVLSFQSWGPEILKFFPSVATAAIVEPATSAANPVEYLSWWGGVLLLVAYGAVFAVAGAASTLRRDIT
jgi:ABC-2 type transport system permease protein